MWFVFQESEKAPIRAVATALTTGEGMAIQWADLLEKENNQVTLRIKAEKAVISEDRKNIKLSNFSMVSYDENSERTTIIASDGMLNNDTKDVTAKGGVLVMDSQGRAMYAEKLIWDEGRKTLTSDSKVKIFGGNFVIKGNRLEIRTAEGKARISRGVSAIFQKSK